MKDRRILSSGRRKDPHSDWRKSRGIIGTLFIGEKEAGGVSAA